MSSARHLIVLALAGLALAPARSQPSATQLLLIVREQIIADSEVAYAANESAIAKTCVRLSCPHSYLALVPVDKSREVWWLNTFTSLADKARVDSAWANNSALMAQLRPLAERKKNLRGSPTTTLTTYQPGVSSQPFRLGDAPFYVITIRRETGKASGSVFRSSDGQYFVVVPASSRGDADRIAARAGDGSHILVPKLQWSVLGK